MDIAVVGTGYVGLVTGAGLADFGNDVVCVDVDVKKIDALRNGQIPIYEPGLDKLVSKNVAEGRLRFTTEPLDDSLARVVSTRVGRSLDGEGRRSFVIDFEGAGPVPEDLVPEVSSSAGEIHAARGHVVSETGAYRASFELDPDGEELVELRVALHSGSRPWSETWLYRWTR